MTGIRVASLDDPRIADYRSVRDGAWIRERGLLVAESRHVVRRLLRSERFALRSLLVTEAALADLAPDLETRGDVPTLLVAPKAMLAELAGFPVHQGCLALAECGAAARPDALVAAAKSGRGLLVVCEGLADPDNLGAVFRNAAGFGADAVLLAPGGADPLYRKAIRVSIGTTLELPFARIGDWPAGLARVREAGFRVVAAVADAGATPLRALAADPHAAPVAIVLGAESAGLSAVALAECDDEATIPTRAGFDSLNVAAASAIFLHHFSRADATS